jgi:hypothetical protein
MFRKDTARNDFLIVWRLFKTSVYHHRMMGWLIRKDVWGSRRDLTDTITALAWKDWEKPQKPKSVQPVSGTKIWTRDFRNTKQTFSS